MSDAPYSNTCSLQYVHTKLVTFVLYIVNITKLSAITALLSGP